MEKLDSLDKAKLFKKDIWDLRQANYGQLLDIAKVYFFNDVPNATIKRSLTDAELMQLILNSHIELAQKKNPLYIIDTETICRLVNSVQLFNRSVQDAAVKEIVSRARMADDETPDKEQLLENLKCKNALLEEGMRSLILAKTVILPATDNKQSEKEIKQLRKDLEQALFGKQKAECRVRVLEKKIDKIRQDIF